jgi:CMP-N-acetylneuraminic acid synthetase
MHVENGAIWIVNAQQFSLQRIVRIEPFALYTGMDESESMDIDTPLDFWLCEQMVEWRKTHV